MQLSEDGIVNQPGRRNFTFWHMAGAVFALGAIWAFLVDIIKADWIAWVVPPVLFMIFCGMLWRIRPGSFARAALWFLAILFVAFVTIHDVLDFILDPIIRADVPIAAATLLVLAGLWSKLSALIALEEV